MCVKAKVRCRVCIFFLLLKWTILASIKQIIVFCVTRQSSVSLLLKVVHLLLYTVWCQYTQSHTLTHTHMHTLISYCKRGQLFTVFLQRSVSHRNPLLSGFRQPLFVRCRVHLILYPLGCVSSVPVSRHQHLRFLLFVRIKCHTVCWLCLVWMSLQARTDQAVSSAINIRMKSVKKMTDFSFFSWLANEIHCTSVGEFSFLLLGVMLLYFLVITITL